MEENAVHLELDAMLGTRACSEPVAILENNGVVRVEKSLLEGM